MEIKELADILSQMYNDTPKGEKNTQVILFGIKYSKDVKQAGIKQVVRQSVLFNTKYGSEVSKGVKLSHHVNLK